MLSMTAARVKYGKNAEKRTYTYPAASWEAAETALGRLSSDNSPYRRAEQPFAA
jgi:hypothetical protein